MGKLAYKERHQGKLQVMTTMSVSYVFALVDDKKNATSASCRRSRPSWELEGAGCSNQMQVAQGQDLVRVSIYITSHYHGILQLAQYIYVYT